jgi:aminomethyltransferase
VEIAVPLSFSPLQETHQKAGARMVPFAGWMMPVQYQGITGEHLAVRNSCGIFDISHMGEFRVAGPAARDWLNTLLTNNTTRLGIGQGQYTLLLNEQGGVIDDLILYRTGRDAWFLVVNASKIGEDFAWMHSRLIPGVTLENQSATFAGLAVQGPMAAAIYQKVAGAHQELPDRNGIASFISLRGGTCIVCRTGYTGEDGFEFFCETEEAAFWWDEFVEHGAVPCGLGARDTLRLEMGYPLNGNDLSQDRTPLEAGLGFFVDMEKPAFTGREVLAHQKVHGLPSKLTGLRLTEKGPPLRAHYPVYSGGQPVGELCSGGLSPSLGYGIAMAYLPPALATPGTTLEIDIRNKRYPAETLKKPFCKKL